MTSVQLVKGWLAIGCRRRLSNLLTFTWNFQLICTPANSNHWSSKETSSIYLGQISKGTKRSGATYTTASYTNLFLPDCCSAGLRRSSSDYTRTLLRARWTHGPRARTRALATFFQEVLPPRTRTFQLHHYSAIDISQRCVRYISLGLWRFLDWKDGVRIT